MNLVDVDYAMVHTGNESGQMPAMQILPCWRLILFDISAMKY